MARTSRHLVQVSLGVLLLVPSFSLAGGGGQNMLLVVNPNDEASLRIANAYVAARAIPERNIVYLAPPTGAGYKLNSATYAQFTSMYRDALPSIMRQRGIEGQVDYIGTIGQPQALWGNERINGTLVNLPKLSFNYMLSRLSQIEAGMYYKDTEFRLSDLYQASVPYTAAGTTPAPLPYTPGSNNAIHHSTQYPISTTLVPSGVAQYYVSGNIGYSGTHAITTDQVVANFARSASGDGQKPAGKVYFIENDNVRSETREYYWPSVQQYMSSRGMAWEQNRQLYDGAPKNKPDVRGAVVGAAVYNMPNGSTYLPGSYADCLTSNGGGYNTIAQTKSDKFIRAGAAGTAGAITEPYAIADRFTQSTFYIYHGEGSTLGESYFKSVRTPDVVMLQGDLLAQPYADVPRLTLNSAPANNAVVSGSLSIEASATLASPTFATGVSKLQLYVDGIEKSSVNAASGALSLDTLTLSDGRHELRVVATNDAQAQSQGYAISTIYVNNRGQSVSASLLDNMHARWNELVQVPISAAAGSGTVSRVELRSLGRVLGQTSGATGEISLNAQLLAFGANTVTPVAVFDDGSEVVGQPVQVNRDFNKLPGATPTPVASRAAGLKMEFFTGRAGQTLAQTSFLGAADNTLQAPVLTIDPDSTVPANVNFPSAYLGNNTGLAVRITSLFSVATEGEYSFFFDTYNMNFDSLRLSIDGNIITSHEFWNGTTYDGAAFLQGADTLRSAYLMPGEHSLEMLLGNPTSNTDDRLQIYGWWRGPSGDTVAIDSTNFYTAIPEPASLTLVLIGMGATLSSRQMRSGRARKA